MNVLQRRAVMVRYTGDDSCSICLSPLHSSAKNRFVKRLACGHHFHPACIKKWKRHTCPLCRADNFFKHYHYTNTVKGKHILYINRFLPSIFNLVMRELRRYYAAVECHGTRVARQIARRYVDVRRKRPHCFRFLTPGSIQKKFIQERPFEV
jgi:hypothetical protein